ncbi:MAG: hypothetical protein RIE22_07395 [Alphaproteobacteria bacterium]
MTRKDAYLRQIEGRMKEWRADMLKLEARLEQEEGRRAAELSNRVDELRTRQREAEAELHRLGEAGEYAWEDLTRGAEAAWEAFRKGIEKARREFD